MFSISILFSVLSQYSYTGDAKIYAHKLFCVKMCARAPREAKHNVEDDDDDEREHKNEIKKNEKKYAVCGNDESKMLRSWKKN